MADDRSLPFEKRAYENYRDEMKEVGAIACLVEKREREEIEEYREPLSIDEKRELTILLSWGGPSDGYRILFDKDNEAVEGYYFFADWFEYKEFKLTDKELDRVLSVYPVTPVN